ncbi:MAG TPA: hypothetical protein VL097_02815 [Rhodanobacter sp.]|nr:hypothetical protein [Rhodanobacter sp.]
MSLRRLGTGILFGLAAWALAGSATAQIAPRLTGAAVVAELEATRHELAARAASLPHSNLDATSQRLADMADALRKSLGNDAGKPIELMDANAKGSAYRAHAAVQRAKAYLDASKGCPDADSAAMAEALASTVAAVAGASGSSRFLPVVNSVETFDQRPLFVLRDSRKDTVFALVGDNLFDAQCEDPVVVATDAAGKRQGLQPTVTGVQPNRIELKLPAGSQLPSGSYVLHVMSKRKAFLVGCAAQPEAVAVIQMAPAARVSVSYALAATCPGNGAAGKAMPPVTGTMPDLTGAGTSAQRVDAVGCSDPISYTISAKVTSGEGHVATVGPVSQIASAGITTGLPGGLVLSWDPSVHELFMRSAGTSCKGVY